MQSIIEATQRLNRLRRIATISNIDKMIEWCHMIELKKRGESGVYGQWVRFSMQTKACRTLSNIINGHTNHLKVSSEYHKNHRNHVWMMECCWLGCCGYQSPKWLRSPTIRRGETAIWCKQKQLKLRPLLSSWIDFSLLCCTLLADNYT